MTIKVIATASLSNVIFRTPVQQLTRFRITRSLCSIAHYALTIICLLECFKYLCDKLCFIQ